MATHLILLLEFLEHWLICAKVLLHPVVGRGEVRPSVLLTAPPGLNSPLNVRQELALLLEDSSVVHAMIVPLLLQADILLLCHSGEAQTEVVTMQLKPVPSLT